KGEMILTKAHVDEREITMHAPAIARIFRSGLQLDCAPAFADCVLLASHESIEPSQVCMAVGAVGRLFDRVFEVGPSGIEKLLRAGGIALRESDAAMKETFRCRSAVGVGKFVERRSLEGALGTGVIALDHRHFPTNARNRAVWIEAGWDFAQERLQQMRFSFPPELDVTSLGLCDERRRRHRSHPVRGPRRLRPVTQSCLREE